MSRFSGGEAPGVVVAGVGCVSGTGPKDCVGCEPWCEIGGKLGTCKGGNDNGTVCEPTDGPELDPVADVCIGTVTVLPELGTVGGAGGKLRKG